ncbi:MAG: hypothetical protein ACRC57_00425 [Sarcina sp.]
MGKKIFSLCISAAFMGIIGANVYLPQKNIPIHNNKPSSIALQQTNINKLDPDSANEIKSSLEDNLEETQVINHIYHSKV